MYNYIELPVLTAGVRKLVDNINENIRLINVLVRQLTKQQKHMQSMKDDQNDKQKEYDTLVEAGKKLDGMRVECCNKMFQIAQDLASAGVFQISRKIELKKQEKANDKRREELDNRVVLLEAKKEKLAKMIAQIPREIEEICLPNYKLHLSNLYQALREYRTNAETFECLTGIKLQPITADDLLDVAKDKKTYPTIKPHTEEYLPIKVSQKSYKIFVPTEEEM